MNAAQPYPLVPPGTDNTPPRVYGIQTAQVWEIGQSGARSLLDTVPNCWLWRLSVTGDVVITLTWGTRATRTLTLDAPLVADLPGNVAVVVAPRVSPAAAKVTALCTLTEVRAASSSSVLRRFVPAPGGAGAALHDDAARFVALAASSVTIRGVAVALVAGQSIPLVSGSTLDAAGTGYLEFEV
jgi:hypothetical protein